MERWRDVPPFEVRSPDGTPHRIGNGEPAFVVAAKTERGVAALRSLDELRIAEAYVSGDLDFDGDMMSLMELRAQLTDRHPLRFLWVAWLQPALRGRIRGDKKSINEHYDLESEFFLKFIEQRTRCYSHGYFESESESLEEAVRRKLDTAIESCGIQPGWRILDIGAGWGTVVEYAGRRGVNVTSLTISEESQRYVSDLIRRDALPCRVLLEHFLDHHDAEGYDAIVNLGVTEHLPDYRATLRQYLRLLKPGGRVFLDACGSRRQHSVSSWTRKHIWTGTGQFLYLSRYIRAVERSPLELLWVTNDRWSYMLTMKHWALNIERARDEICARWGEELYRRFRLYLWGGAHMLKTGKLTAYRMLLELPPGR